MKLKKYLQLHIRPQSFNRSNLMKLNKLAGIIAVLFFATLPFNTHFVSAYDNQEATETAKTVDEKIQGIRDEVKKAVEEKIQEIVDQEIKKGWVGIIKSKDKTILVIEDKQGNQKEILYDNETTIIGENRKTLTIDDLVIGKNILAMGYLQSAKILEGKRILFIEEENKNEVHSIIGVISDKSRDTKLIAIIPSKDKERVVEINIETKTGITLDDNNKTGLYDDLEIGQKIVIVFSIMDTENVAKILKVVSEK